MVGMDKIVSLCKRRGFIFQSSEIYGGTRSYWDYRQLDAELINIVKPTRWYNLVRSRTDLAGPDWSMLMHPRVWQASDHL